MIKIIDIFGGIALALTVYMIVIGVMVMAVGLPVLLLLRLAKWVLL